MANENISTLLKRIEMFLEDGDWKKADEYCERVLDIEPECAEAYLGKLMAELKVRKKEELKKCETPFYEKEICNKVIRFGDKKLKVELLGYIEYVEATVKKKREELDIKKKNMLVMARLVLPIMCITIAAFFILFKIVIMPELEKNKQYEEAMVMLQNEDYIEAYEALVNLNDYKDSKALSNSIYLKYQLEKIKKAGVWEYVSLGKYEQNGDRLDGKEEIEWLVLKKEKGKALLISKYGLDCKPYNDVWEDVTWESCTLRKWLNEEFIDNAFSPEERKYISYERVPADGNPIYKEATPGNLTIDRIFVISNSEARKYFVSDANRTCKPTKYAVKQGAYLDSETGNCMWWLRNPGLRQNCADCIGYLGYVNMSFGTGVHFGENAIRPAMWINLNAQNIID